LPPSADNSAFPRPARSRGRVRLMEERIRPRKKSGRRCPPGQNNFFSRAEFTRFRQEFLWFFEGIRFTGMGIQELSWLQTVFALPFFTRGEEADFPYAIFRATTSARARTSRPAAAKWYGTWFARVPNPSVSSRRTLGMGHGPFGPDHLHQAISKHVAPGLPGGPAAGALALHPQPGLANSRAVLKFNRGGKTLPIFLAGRRVDPF